MSGVRFNWPLICHWATLLQLLIMEMWKCNPHAHQQRQICSNWRTQIQFSAFSSYSFTINSISVPCWRLLPPPGLPHVARHALSCHGKRDWESFKELPDLAGLTWPAPALVKHVKSSLIFLGTNRRCSWHSLMSCRRINGQSKGCHITWPTARVCVRVRVCVQSRPICVRLAGKLQDKQTLHNGLNRRVNLQLHIFIPCKNGVCVSGVVCTRSVAGMKAL